MDVMKCRFPHASSDGWRYQIEMGQDACPGARDLRLGDAKPAGRVCDRGSVALPPDLSCLLNSSLAA